MNQGEHTSAVVEPLAQQGLAPAKLLLAFAEDDGTFNIADIFSSKMQKGMPLFASRPEIGVRMGFQILLAAES